MNSKIHLALLVVGTLILNAPVFAASMRPAGSKACYPTEETYFDKDGVTPVFCAPAGGPSYSFEVYVGDRLLWEGKLVSTEPEVYFKLPTTTEAEKRLLPRLVIKRDLERDPSGKVVFFGESSLGAIKTYSAGGSTLQLPEMYERGATVVFPLAKKDGTIPVGKISGAVFDQNDYRLVIRSE